MRLTNLSFILCLFLFSCKPVNEENETIPDTILSEEVMTDVLMDAYLAEGASSINIKNVSAEKFDSTYSFNPLTSRNIQSSQFDSSLVYYTKHPQKLKLIYEKVLEKLSQYQSMIEAEKAMAPTK
jgi:hypothetical protein